MLFLQEGSVQIARSFRESQQSDRFIGHPIGGRALSSDCPGRNVGHNWVWCSPSLQKREIWHTAQLQS